MTRRKQVNKGKIVGAVVSVILFVIVIANAEKLSISNEWGYVNPVFVGEGASIPTINMNVLPTSIDDTEDGTIIQYIVQPADTFESIATEFGTTVANLKKINNISSLQPGEKIVVTNEEEWIIYTVRETQNIKVFAQKYNLDLKDLMTLNYILDDSEMLQEGQELFINISSEKADKIPGFIDKVQPNLNPQPKPVAKPKTTNTSKSTGSTSKASNTSTSKGSSSSTTNTSKSNTTSSKTTSSSSSSSSSTTLSRRTYTKNISNGFARGYCTWYVATQKPSLFPYTSDTTQSRTFGGNANQRYKNAQAAGIPVGSTPKAGAIIVYSQLRSSAGHVGIVRAVDRDKGTMTIEDMNYEGKFVVTKRTESINRGGIIGYIYG